MEHYLVGVEAAALGAAVILISEAVLVVLVLFMTAVVSETQMVALVVLPF
jgi:hypothetical protein